MTSVRTAEWGIHEPPSRLFFGLFDYTCIQHVWFLPPNHFKWNICILFHHCVSKKLCNFLSLLFGLIDQGKLNYFLFILCCMLTCFVLFQTVLFSSFSGILFLICFTNCPPAFWCFHIDASFSVTTCPHQKCFLRKHPRIHQPYLSLHTSFFPPLSHAFNFCLFWGEWLL